MRRNREGNTMKKVVYIFGALACRVGLFYLILMLTRDRAG